MKLRLGQLVSVRDFEDSPWEDRVFMCYHEYKIMCFYEAEKEEEITGEYSPRTWLYWKLREKKK